MRTAQPCPHGILGKTYCRECRRVYNKEHYRYEPTGNPRGRPAGARTGKIWEKSDEIIRRASAGETLQSIASDFGITREWVRLVLKKLGFKKNQPCLSGASKSCRGHTRDPEGVCPRCRNSKNLGHAMVCMDCDSTQVSARGRCRKHYLKWLYHNYPGRKERLLVSMKKYMDRVKAENGPRWASIKAAQIKTAKRWHKNHPEYRSPRQTAEYQRNRYRNDPVFREKEKARKRAHGKLKYRTDPEYRERMLASRKARYHEKKSQDGI